MHTDVAYRLYASTRHSTKAAHLICSASAKLLILDTFPPQRKRARPRSPPNQLASSLLHKRVRFAAPLEVGLHAGTGPSCTPPREPKLHRYGPAPILWEANKVPMVQVGIQRMEVCDRARTGDP